MSWLDSLRQTVVEWMIGRNLDEWTGDTMLAESAGRRGGHSIFDPSPTSRTAEEALEAYDTSTILRTCASIVATRLASHRLEWVTSGGEVRDDVPQLGLLDSPNTEMSGVRFRRTIYAQLKLTGEAICVIVPSSEANDAGIELLPVPPHDMELETDGGEVVWELDYGSLDLTLDPRQVLHIPEPAPADPWGRPTGTAQVVATELDIERHAGQHMTHLLANDATPDTVMYFTGANRDAQKAIKTQIVDEYRGAQGRGRPYMAGTSEVGGRMEVHPMDHSPADLELSELTQDQRMAVRESFHVSPEIIGHVEDANRATVEAAELIFARSVTKPTLSLIVAALNHHLAEALRGPAGRYRVPTGVVPEDKDRKLQAAKDHPGAFRANELRQWVGAPAIEEMEGETLADVQPQPAAPGGFAGTDPVESGGGGKGGGGPTLKIYSGVDKSVREEAEKLASRITSTSELREALQRSTLATTQAAAGRVGGALSADISVDDLNPVLRRTVNARVDGILPDIDDHTRTSIKDAVLEGFEEGGAHSARDRLADLDAFDDARAERIARTETTRAANDGSHQMQKASDVVDWRQWMTGASGVRDAHQKLAGVKKPVDQPFTVNGHSAMYPGDFGVAALDINCRCTTVPTDPPSDEESSGEIVVIKELEIDADGWRDMIDGVMDERLSSAQTEIADTLEADRQRALELFDQMIAS